MVLILHISLGTVEKTLRDSFITGICLETYRFHGSNIKLVGYAFFS